MKRMTLTITLIITVVAVALAYNAMSKAIKYQAIDGCLQAGTARFKNPAGQDVEVPEEYWYEFCMKEKGLRD